MMSQATKIAVPFNRAWISKADRQAVANALRNGRDVLTNGPKVRAFEEAVAQQAGFPYAVAVCHGTCAIELALKAMGLGLGDTVALDPRTYRGVANAVEPVTGRRAVVRYADTPPTAFHCVVECSLYGETPQGVALLGGEPWSLPRIEKVPGSTFLLLDAARMFGNPDIADYQWATLSFHPLKTITTGEGGMVLCRDAEAAEKLREGRNQRWGNYRMTEMQAALGLSQLTSLAWRLGERMGVASRYHAAGLVEWPGDEAPCAWNAALMRVVDPPKAQALFQAQGVEVKLPKPLVPGAAGTSYVMLPIWSGMPAAMVQKVVEAGKRVKEVQ